MQEPDRNPALDRLEALVGDWTMEAGPPGGPAWPGEATVSFEWLDGRWFLIQRWKVEMPEAPDGIALIGLGESDGTFQQHFFDSRGVHRIYEMTLDDGVWTLWRYHPGFSQRYEGRVSEDGKAIEGRWEKQLDSGHWEIDFDLTYTKVS
jgi:hypothetical protein